MWNSAHVMDMVNEAKNYGVIASAGKFDWPTLKEARDSYITRLNGIYERNLGNSGVKIIQGVSTNDSSRSCVRLATVMALKRLRLERTGPGITNQKGGCTTK